MKPLKLSIEGLHSFQEKQVIDFTQLSDTGLFGIFGNTGSGKSTILDAITLALYGSVFRASNRTQGILNSQMDKMGVSFTFKLGLNENRQIYRVDRGYKRNKDKRDSVIATVCRLLEISRSKEIVLADGSTEVTKMIEELIGLSMEDFTRSVVLPQGEFSKFLHLKDSERIRMLERIFSLQDYGARLTEKAKQERAFLTHQLELVENSILEQGNVTCEEVEQAEAKLQKLEVDKASIFREMEQLEEDYQKAAFVFQCQTELLKFQTDEAELLLRQPEIEYAQELLTKAETAEKLTPYYDEFLKLDRLLTEASHEFSTAQAAFEVESVTNRQAQIEFEAADQMFRNQQPELITERTRIEAVLTLEKDLERKKGEYGEAVLNFKITTEKYKLVQKNLTEIETLKKSHESLLKSLETRIQALTVSADRKERLLEGVDLEKECRRLIEEYKQIQADVKGESDHQAALEASLETGSRDKAIQTEQCQTLESFIEQLQINKPGDFEVLTRTNQQMHQLEMKLQEIGVRSSDLEKENLFLTELNARRQSLMEKYQICHDKLEDSGAELGKLENEQRLIEEEIKSWQHHQIILELAASLDEGHPCPVCGSVTHPQIVKAYEKMDISVCEEKYSHIKQKIETLLPVNESLKAEELKLRMSIEQVDEQLKSQMAKVDLLRTNLVTLRSALPLEWQSWSIRQLQQYLNEEKEKSAKLSQALVEWEQSVRTEQQRLETAKERVLAADKVVYDLRGKLSGNQKTLERLMAQATTLKDNFQVKQEAYKTLKFTLNVNDFQEEYAVVQTGDRKIEELQHRSKQVNTDIAEAEVELNRIRQELEQLNLQLSRLDAARHSFSTEMAELSGKINAVTMGRKPLELLEETNRRLKELEVKRQTIAEQYQRSQQLLQQYLQQRTETAKQVQLYQKDREHAFKNVNQKLTGQGFLNLNEYRDSLKSPEEQLELKTTITQYLDRKKEIQVKIFDLNQKLGGRKLENGQWEKIQKLRSESIAKKDQIVAEYAQFQLAFQDLTRRWHKIEEYQKNRSQLLLKKSMADEIGKMLQGEAFVAYIAEEHMRYILQDASEQLRMLTGGRYLLGADQDKNFIITDQTNGGLSRPVSSLSGGETFLVSLSLALALSSKIQLNGKNPLEFFFLDEGFGTLDAQLLEVVMDALERLRQGKLLVGVISHVSELKQRINRRLLVSGAIIDGGSKVRIEKS